MKAPSSSLRSDPVAPAGAMGTLVAGSDSPAQRERRERILGAAVALGRRGDFEAVQMRLVADRADVALGTLYRYFPSKVHLLLAVLVGELEEEVVTSLPSGETASTRVIGLADRSIHAHLADPHLKSATIRAYVFASESAPREAAKVNELTLRIICQVMRAGEPITADDVDIAEVIADVWLSAKVGWVAGRLTPEEVRVKMERAARLLL